MNGIEQFIISLKQAYEETIDLMKPEEEGLSHGHMFLLFIIRRRGSIKTTEISQHFALSPGAATAIADRLEQMGLITRVRDVKDRRVVFVSLTEKGIGYVEDQKSRHLALFHEVLKDFSEDELWDTFQVLTRMTKAIQLYKHNIQGT